MDNTNQIAMLEKTASSLIPEIEKAMTILRAYHEINTQIESLATGVNKLFWRSQNKLMDAALKELTDAFHAQEVEV